MLTSVHRMRRSGDFVETLRGRRAGTRTVVVACRSAADNESSALEPHIEPPTEPPTEPIVGFIVSRAIGGAVVRNQVRRRLRHVVRPLVPDLAPGARVVVRALAPAVGATPEELAADVSSALRRSGAYAAATAGVRR